MPDRPQAPPVPPRAAPDSAEVADAAASWWSAYIHIPFCARRCPYCDFAVVTPDEQIGPVHRYVEALVAEIARAAGDDDRARPARPLDAVYFGGGTTSQLEAAQLRRVVGALDRRYGLAADAEISLEANPEDWDDAGAAELRAAGFTRVSFGVQSFDEAVLAYLGRAHTPAQAAEAVRAAREAGFVSINVDLIYGSPLETDWPATVDRTIDLGPDHVSAYGLTVERGTELSRSIAAGAPAPDPDRQADAYEAAASRLEASGYVRYEVSNYAKAGHGVRYTLGAWAQGPYLGFGLGAHDHLADGSEPTVGIRRRNIRRLDTYLSAVEAGESPEAGRDRIAGWDREQERLFLGIRRTAGVVAGPGGEALLASDDGRRLAAAGVIAEAGGRIVVRRPLLTDEVSRAIFDVSPPS